MYCKSMVLENAYTDEAIPNNKKKKTKTMSVSVHLSYYAKYKNSNKIYSFLRSLYSI